MPVVWVHSANAIVHQALCTYLEGLGYRTVSEPDDAADIAVWNLCGQQSPFSPPPPVPTLALMCQGHDEELVELMRLGYRGYLQADEPPEVLKRALAAVMKGEVWAQRNVLAKSLTPIERPRLTPRETQIMSLMTLGLTNLEIVHRLGSTENTVKTHVSSILGKYGSKNRVDLMMRGRGNGGRHTPLTGVQPED